VAIIKHQSWVVIPIRRVVLWLGLELNSRRTDLNAAVRAREAIYDTSVVKQ